MKEIILLSHKEIVKEDDESKDMRRSEGLNKNGEDPKRLEILSAQFMMESVLVVRSKIGGDILSPRAKAGFVPTIKTQKLDPGVWTILSSSTRQHSSCLKVMLATRAVMEPLAQIIQD